MTDDPKRTSEPHIDGEALTPRERDFYELVAGLEKGQEQHHDQLSELFKLHREQLALFGILPCKEHAALLMQIKDEKLVERAVENRTRIDELARQMSLVSAGSVVQVRKPPSGEQPRTKTGQGWKGVSQEDLDRTERLAIQRAEETAEEVVARQMQHIAELEAARVKARAEAEAEQIKLQAALDAERKKAQDAIESAQTKDAAKRREKRDYAINFAKILLPAIISALATLGAVRIRCGPAMSVPALTATEQRARLREALNSPAKPDLSIHGAATRAVGK